VLSLKTKDLQELEGQSAKVGLVAAEDRPSAVAFICGCSYWQLVTGYFFSAFAWSASFLNSSARLWYFSAFFLFPAPPADFSPALSPFLSYSSAVWL